MFFKKKRVTFDKAAKFNYELDTNEALKGTLLKLSLSRNKMKKEDICPNFCVYFAKKEWISR